jgi:NADH/NAD ratio-sensing transcriptional regulator Rex
VAERLNVGVAARLSRYLQVLTQARKMGKSRISSQEIAEYTNINATQIRRDLSNFGKFGKRGVGYSIELLLDAIRKILRTQGQHNVALVGAGRLGQAIASSRRSSGSRSAVCPSSRTSGSRSWCATTTSSSACSRFRPKRRSARRTTSSRPA